MNIAPIRFVRSVLIHMRPYLLFVSGISGLAGMSLFEGTLGLQKFSLLFICFFLGYGFGQALTDCFQTDTDKISSPYRPLSQGLISKQALFGVSLAGLLLIGATLIYSNSSNIVLAIATVIGLISYTHFKKNYWMGGPIWNSLIVSLLPILGLLSADPSLGLNVIWSVPMLSFVIAFNFFAYFNFVLIGYLKDITADRETNYNTFPVRFGWSPTVMLGNVILGLGILFLWFSVPVFTTPVGIFMALAFIVGVYGQIKAIYPKEKSEEYSHIPIESTVRFFLLGNAAIVLSNKPELLLFVSIFYVGFELILFLRPERNQI